MKSENVTGTTSITATAALAPKLFVGFDGGICGAGAKALGVNSLDVDIGQQASVKYSGVLVVLSGGAVALGEAVASDAAGKAVAATAFSVTVPAGATGVTSSAAQPNLVEAGGVLPQAVNGHSLDVATGANQEIRILRV